MPPCAKTTGAGARLSRAAADAAGLLGAPEGEKAGLDVGEGGGEAVALVNQADLGLDACGAADGGEEGVAGEIEEGGGVDAAEAGENVFAGEEGEHGVTGPGEGLLRLQIGRRDDRGEPGGGDGGVGF